MGPDEAAGRQGSRPRQHRVRGQARETSQFLDPGDELSSRRSAAIEAAFEVQVDPASSSLQGGAQRGGFSQHLDDPDGAHVMPVRDLGHQAGDCLHLAGSRADARTPNIRERGATGMASRSRTGRTRRASDGKVVLAHLVAVPAPPAGLQPCLGPSWWPAAMRRSPHPHARRCRPGRSAGPRWSPCRSGPVRPGVWPTPSPGRPTCRPSPSAARADGGEPPVARGHQRLGQPPVQDADAAGTGVVEELGVRHEVGDRRERQRPLEVAQDGEVGTPGTSSRGGARGSCPGA